MDSEIEKYVTKQSQLEKQIEELLFERKILQNRISILNECVSYEKVKKKISELENKQNMLKSLESMVNQIRTEIKPLDYLKQLLQKQLMLSSLTTTINDLNIEKQTFSINSQLKTNSDNATEILDSSSEAGSEGSVMVLSEYDVVLDDEVSENTDKTITNKVMYDEAVHMASSVHSLLVESPTTNIESIEPLLNVDEEKNDSNVQNSNALMDTSMKIQQLLEMYEVVKKKDLISSTENAKMKLGVDKGKIESIINEVCALSFSDETLGDIETNLSNNIRHDNMPKLLNDSWVKVDTDNILDISMKSEQPDDIFQTTTELQKDKTTSNANLDEQIQIQTVKLCNDLLDSKEISEITKLENIMCNGDNNLKNEINDSVSLNYNSRNEGTIESSLLNIKYSSKPKVNTETEIDVDNDQLCSHLTELKKCNEIKQNSSNKVLKDKTEIGTNFLIKHEGDESKVNNKVENNMQNDQLSSHLSELKENNGIKHFQNISNQNLDNSDKIENCNPVCIDIVLKDKIETVSPFLNIKLEGNEPEVNTELKTHVLHDQLLHSNLIQSEKNSKIKYFQNADNNLKNKVYNQVCPAIDVNNYSVIESSLMNTECSSVLREYNDPKLSIQIEIYDEKNDVSSNHQFKSDQISMQLYCKNEFNTLGLNVQLLNGIHQHGFQHLMTLQQNCISYCINGRDIVLNSYPCTGKSTMCFITVLHKIDTSINECQAIILVPTLELALFTQKIIKSLGKFMNVVTCIGGTNVPRKVSPVPHVVISTLQGLCDMISCNSLSKDFIKMLIIDDADEIIKSHGFFNKIRNILLFLNNDRQLIILSTSELEEILDYFSDTMQDLEYIILSDEKPSLDDILQYYITVPEEWKFDALTELYTILNLRRTIIYCNTWDKSLALAENVRLKTCKVSAVYSEMDTNQRQFILRQFQNNICKLLVTTGLLKGEDFSGVMYVINYDFPKCPKNYVRRIVDCLNRQVKVINFITPNDKKSKENIETTFNMHMLYLPQDLTNFDLTSILSNS